jgi:hypothetical protein
MSTIVLVIGVHGYVGLSHVVAAILGLPGCELRMLAYFVAKARGAPAPLAACPGVWTPLDRWEARRRDSD